MMVCRGTTYSTCSFLMVCFINSRCQNKFRFRINAACEALVEGPTFRAEAVGAVFSKLSIVQHARTIMMLPDDPQKDHEFHLPL